MKHYQILVYASMIELENAVEQHMRDGWVPQGGIFVKGSLPTHYYQAMVK